MASSLLQYVAATPFSPSTLSCVLIVSIFAVLLSTRIVTNLRSRPSLPGTGAEPPVAPYWIPYLQHLVPFLTNPNKTFHSNRARYPNIPFTLLMMNTKFHVFDSPTTASYVFSRSRDFVFEPVVASMMENGVNLPVVDRPKFQMPLGPHRALSKEQQESKDFVSTNHATYIKYLTGDLLDDIMMVYMDNFHAVLKEILDMSGEGSISVDFHELMRKIIFETSVTTFFGTRLRKFWSNMWQDWKLFNDATFAGVRSNFSFYMQPRAFAARERMLRAFDKWVDCDMEEWDVTDGVWNEKWGVRMNWEREALGRKSGFSPRGRACLQASFLFVIVTNAAPMATCFTMSILESPDRLKRFRREALDTLLPYDNEKKNSLRFDVSALKASRFIQGIWKEALRLYSASAAARVVTKDTEIEGYVVKTGSVILLPVQLMHHNPDAFPTPEKFDPERWIFDVNERSQAQQQRKQAASLRSFGGGTGLCSGRFVAEQEIISTVATMLILFDVEIESPSELRLNPRSIGIMSPARPVKARLRRREISE